MEMTGEGVRLELDFELGVGLAMVAVGIQLSGGRLRSARCRGEEWDGLFFTGIGRRGGESGSGSGVGVCGCGCDCDCGGVWNREVLALLLRVRIGEGSLLGGVGARITSGVEIIFGGVPDGVLASPTYS